MFNNLNINALVVLNTFKKTATNRTTSRIYLMTMHKRGTFDGLMSPGLLTRCDVVTTEKFNKKQSYFGLLYHESLSTTIQYLAL